MKTYKSGNIELEIVDNNLIRIKYSIISIHRETMIIHKEDLLDIEKVIKEWRRNNEKENDS